MKFYFCIYSEMTEFMIPSMFLHLNHKAKALQSFLDELYLISSKLVMVFFPLAIYIYSYFCSQSYNVVNLTKIIMLSSGSKDHIKLILYDVVSGTWELQRFGRELLGIQKKCNDSFKYNRNWFMLSIFLKSFF